MRSCLISVPKLLAAIRKCAKALRENPQKILRQKIHRSVWVSLVPAISSYRGWWASWKFSKFLCCCWRLAQWRGPPAPTRDSWLSMCVPTAMTLRRRWTFRRGDETRRWWTQCSTSVESQSTSWTLQSWTGEAGNLTLTERGPSHRGRSRGSGVHST